MSSLRIMSFNIRYDNPEDHTCSWKYRKERVASMIRFHQVDVCGLQEVLLNQLSDLQSFLPEYDYIGVGREDGEQAGEFSPVFYRKDRVSPIALDTFWLSETPEVKGSLGWDAVCKRIVTWVKFKDLRTDHVFYHFNTHFDHAGELAKQQSARLLHSYIQRSTENDAVVVTGDFNATPDSRVYAILTEPSAKSLSDSRLCTLHDHHGPSITFHAFRGDQFIQRMINEEKIGYKWHGEEMFSLIDYLFVSDQFTVLQEAVLADHWDGAYPSDHFPVVADLRIK